MQALAAAIPPQEIGRVCYKLYEIFRCAPTLRLCLALPRSSSSSKPRVFVGPRRPPWHGWGGKGTLSLSRIRELAGSWREV